VTDWDGHLRLAAALDAVAEAGYQAATVAGVRPRVDPGDDERVFFTCPAGERDLIVEILVSHELDARPALWRQQAAVVVVFGADV
jgi:hypothetical protein